MADIVTLVEAKAQLNMTGNADDAELAGFVSAVNEPVARYVGAVVEREVVDTFDGGYDAYCLTRRPVLSVESVTADGVTLDPVMYAPDKLAGVLSATRGYFPRGIQNVVVSYTAGRLEVEPHWRLAALIIIQHLWETQRGKDVRRPRFSNGDETVLLPGFAYAIPNRAAELLGPPTPGIA